MLKLHFFIFHDILSPSMPLSSRISYDRRCCETFPKININFFCVTLRVRLKFNFFFLFLLCLCTLSIYSSSSSSLFFNVCALSKYKYVHNTHDMKMVEIKCKIGQLNFDIRPFVPSESNFFHSLNFVLFC